VTSTAPDVVDDTMNAFETTNRDGGTLGIPADAWRAFLTTLK
jgi:Domain of unknown function (DUF397)